MTFLNRRDCPPAIRSSLPDTTMNYTRLDINNESQLIIMSLPLQEIPARNEEIPNYWDYRCTCVQI